jgi:hypothetical protein
MRKFIEFFVYLMGVVFFSWNYYKIRTALDVYSFLVFVCFFLFGVSRFATWISHKISGREEGG